MKHWAYNTLIPLLLLWIGLGMAYALDTPTTTATTSRYTFKALGLDESISLNSFRSSRTVYVPVQKNQRILDMQLHLILAFSPKLTQNSLLKVYFNQRQIQSITAPFTNAEVEHTLTLPVPPYHTSAWQPLVFSAQFNPLQTFCDPESWIYISPKSYILLRYVEKPFTAKLNALPYPFINKDSPNTTFNEIVTAAKASLPEQLAALYAAFYLGQNSKDIPTSLSYANDQEQKASPRYNRIFVGWDKSFVTTQFPKVTLKNTATADTGILAIQASPKNPAKAELLLGGSSAAGLMKAVQSLADPQYTAVMPGETAEITDLKTLAPAQDISQFFSTSFQKLGYDNQSVSGLGRHKITYEIPMLNNKTTLNAQVKTNITAPIGEGKQYHITLLLNGQKQATTRLQDYHTQWTVSLAKAAFKPGINSLSYWIDLHQAQENCSPQEFDLNWITMYANSEFSAQYQNAYPKANLNDFPVPFAGEVDLIVPDTLQTADMRNLIPLVFKIGQLTAKQAINLRIITAKHLDESTLAQHNLIFYGLPTEHSWLAKTLETLPVRFSQNTRSLQGSKGLLTLKTTAGIGMLQIQPSPWAKERSILMITANTPDMLAKASKAFTSNRKRLDLNGNIAIMNTGGQMQAIQLYSGAYSDFTNRLMLNGKRFWQNSLYYLRYNPEIFLYALVFIVPLFIYVRRRKHEKS